MSSKSKDAIATKSVTDLCLEIEARTQSARDAYTKAIKAHLQALKDDEIRLRFLIFLCSKHQLFYDLTFHAAFWSMVDEAENSKVFFKELLSILNLSRADQDNWLYDFDQRGEAWTFRGALYQKTFGKYISRKELLDKLIACYIQRTNKQSSPALIKSLSEHALLKKEFEGLLVQSTMHLQQVKQSNISEKQFGTMVLTNVRKLKAMTSSLVWQEKHPFDVDAHVAFLGRIKQLTGAKISNPSDAIVLWGELSSAEQSLGQLENSAKEKLEKHQEIQAVVNGLSVFIAKCKAYPTHLNEVIFGLEQQLAFFVKAYAKVAIPESTFSLNTKMKLFEQLQSIEDHLKLVEYNTAVENLSKLRECQTWVRPLVIKHVSHSALVLFNCCHNLKNSWSWSGILHRLFMYFSNQYRIFFTTLDDKLVGIADDNNIQKTAEVQSLFTDTVRASQSNITMRYALRPLLKSQHTAFFTAPNETPVLAPCPLVPAVSHTST